MAHMIPLIREDEPTVTWVNTDHILLVTDQGTRRRLKLVNGGQTFTHETLEKVVQRINDVRVPA
jgi:uncharacterized protein YlzI (FlbEa/FlbD family)